MLQAKAMTDFMHQCSEERFAEAGLRPEIRAEASRRTSRIGTNWSFASARTVGPPIATSPGGTSSVEDYFERGRGLWRIRRGEASEGEPQIGCIDVIPNFPG